MARPNKSKRISTLPEHTCFAPTEKRNNNKLILSVEEFETIRLLDYLGMTQEECAAHMDIGRATVQMLYTEARKKVSRFLVEGTSLCICGGNYTVAEPSVSGGLNKKGDLFMKIAVTYENGEVFQHFGHTEQFKIYEVENGKIVASNVVSTDGFGHGALAGFLLNLNVNVLICGGIGGGARNALSECGIELYPGAVGNADEQVASFLNGKLSYNPDTMCNHHHHEEGHSCGDHGCGSDHSCH